MKRYILLLWATCLSIALQAQNEQKAVSKFETMDVSEFTSSAKFNTDGKKSDGGFLKVKGTEIVNNHGVIPLRGLNVGNWLLQEGYMMQTYSTAPAQHQFKERVVQLIGKEKTETFYKKWRANYITRDDIDVIGKWGFNNIRLPLHYNLFMKEDSSLDMVGPGFALIDSTLKWCVANHMYLILDMHAVPGGQSPDNIADFHAGNLQIWRSKSYQAKLVKLWREIAKKYAKELWIGGYDLINETVYTFPEDTSFRKYFVLLTKEVRKVDKNHILFIEGNNYANNFKNLTPPWDNNMVYSFHKYWNYPDKNSINWVLEMRERYNRPLYCGEFGENSNQWIADAITLFNEQKIAWSIWPYKKLNSTKGFYSVKMPDGYKRLLAYWEGKGEKPTAEASEKALNDLLENVKLKNCILTKDYLHAVTKQAYTKESAAFSAHKLPAVIKAVNYDLGQNGYAYSDIEYTNTSGQPSTTYNSADCYRNDGVDIDYSDAEKSFIVVQEQAGECLCYTVQDTIGGTYNIDVRNASHGTARIALLIGSPKEGGKLLPEVSFAPVSWKEDIWQEKSVGRIKLEKNKPTKVCLTIQAGNLKLSSVKFELVK